MVMDQELAGRIQELADRERRSFARECQVLLEAALERLGLPALGAEEDRDGQ